MDLNQFIQSNPQIAEFNETDSPRHQQLLHLISKPMKLLGIDLVYERSPQFNDLLRAQGLKFKTIISKKKDRLTGLFSISTSPRYLQKLTTNVAYLGDFRIESDLKIAAFWRKHYGLALDLFRKDESLRTPNVFITAILKDNKLAHRTLVENPKGDFKYHFLRPVKMINILSRSLLPLKKQTPQYIVRRVKFEEEERLIEFIDQCEQEKVLGFDFKTNDRELWQQRKKHFPDFKIDNFIVLEGPDDHWLAVTLPASPDSMKRMIIKKMGRSIFHFFNLLRCFNISLPREGEAIKTLYLTHLNIQKSMNAKVAIKELLHFVMNQPSSKNYHMISFADWWQDSWFDYLTYSATIHIYEVTGPQMNAQVNADPKIFNKPFGFEMALV